MECISYQCYGGSCNSEGRRFFTKEEKIQMLKEYKEALDNESQGVSEKIASLEQEK